MVSSIPHCMPGTAGTRSRAELVCRPKPLEAGIHSGLSCAFQFYFSSGTRIFAGDFKLIQSPIDNLLACSSTVCQCTGSAPKNPNVRDIFPRRAPRQSAGRARLGQFCSLLKSYLNFSLAGLVSQSPSHNHSFGGRVANELSSWRCVDPHVED